jgi:phospholipase/carboxylesterase
MARNCIIGLLSIVITLGFGSLGNASDLSDCDRNGSPGKITAAKKSPALIAETQQSCADLSPAGKATVPVAPDRSGGAGDRLLPAADASAIERSNRFLVLRRQPKQATADTLVLLHGSGGDETTLMDLASRIDPRAVLMGIRGRLIQDGVTRWYRRLTPTRFDQNDIRSEAGAFAAFLRDAVEAKKLDLAHTTFIGYSNGANLLAAMALLHPGIVERAVLLRPMSVLESIPEVHLSGARFLTVAGAADGTYAPFAPALEAMLREHGGHVDARTIGSGHDLGNDDVAVVSEWLALSSAVSFNR